MSFMQRSGRQLLLLVLALAGVGISVYLTLVHYAGTYLVCSANGLVDCASVLASSYSFVPGTTIPISIPGLAWCLVAGALAFASWRLWPQRRDLLIAQFAWTLLGMVTVLYLVYAELVRIHRICAWCTALHVIILIMFFTSILNLQEPELEEEEELDSEEEERSVVTARKNRY